MQSELYTAGYDEFMRRCDAAAKGDQAAWVALLRENMPEIFSRPMPPAREEKLFRKFLRTCQHLASPKRSMEERGEGRGGETM